MVSLPSSVNGCDVVISVGITIGVFAPDIIDSFVIFSKENSDIVIREIKENLKRQYYVFH